MSSMTIKIRISNFPLSKVKVAVRAKRGMSPWPLNVGSSWWPAEHRWAFSDVTDALSSGPSWPENASKCDPGSVARTDRLNGWQGRVGQIDCQRELGGRWMSGGEEREHHKERWRDDGALVVAHSHIWLVLLCCHQCCVLPMCSAVLTFA